MIPTGASVPVNTPLAMIEGIGAVYNSKKLYVRSHLETKLKQKESKEQIFLNIMRNWMQL